MTYPAEVTKEQRHHRIATSKDAISFREGRALCGGCGALVTASPEPAYDRDEALADAWLSHRREAGMGRSHNGVGYDRDGVERVFRIRGSV